MTDEFDEGSGLFPALLPARLTDPDPALTAKVETNHGSYSTIVGTMPDGATVTITVE